MGQYIDIDIIYIYAYIGSNALDDLQKIVSKRRKGENGFQDSSGRQRFRKVPTLVSSNMAIQNSPFTDR